MGADECPGVDGNRNFDFAWGSRPDAADPCSIIYEGPSAFSEPEIRVIRDAVLANLPRTPLYISLHSFGNMFLYAWGNNGMYLNIKFQTFRLNYLDTDNCINSKCYFPFIFSTSYQVAFQVASNSIISEVVFL